MEAAVAGPRQESLPDADTTAVDHDIKLVFFPLEFLIPAVEKWRIRGINCKCESVLVHLRQYTIPCSAKSH